MRELLEDVYPILKLLVTFNTEKVRRDVSHRLVLSQRITEASRSLSKLGGGRRVTSYSPTATSSSLQVARPRHQMMSAYALATNHTNSFESAHYAAPNSALPKVVEEEPLHFGAQPTVLAAPSMSLTNLGQVESSTFVRPSGSHSPAKVGRDEQEVNTSNIAGALKSDHNLLQYYNTMHNTETTPTYNGVVPNDEDTHDLDKIRIKKRITRRKIVPPPQAAHPCYFQSLSTKLANSAQQKKRRNIFVEQIVQH